MARPNAISSQRPVEGPADMTRAAQDGPRHAQDGPRHAQDWPRYVELVQACAERDMSEDGCCCLEWFADRRAPRGEA